MQSRMAFLVLFAITVAPLAAKAEEFQPSYVAGFRDPAGQFAGGTEMRLRAIVLG